MSARARSRTTGTIPAVRVPPITPSAFFLLLFYGMSVFYLLAWPIAPSDTDLWFHLDGGRHLVQHGMLANSSYFSFLIPARESPNYSWLFQALVYGIHAATGYYGLLVLRALAFLGTALAVWRYVFTGRGRHRSHAWRVLLVVVIGMILLPRAEMIRPHIFTYLFIAVFLYVLEYRPRFRRGLPVLAVLWCNLHGISYPILLLICGAYLLDDAVKRLSAGGRHSSHEGAARWPLLLSMGAVLLSPHGWSLLGVPFTPLGSAGTYFGELGAPTVTQLTSVTLSRLVPSHQTVFNLWLFGSLLAVMTSLARRQVRVSHLILLIGGLVLVAKAGRFLSVCSLLTLPVLAANPPVITAGFRRRMPRAVALAFTALLALMAFGFLFNRMTIRGPYPLSEVHHRGLDLPRGVAAFLNHVSVGGSVFNHVDPGGYYRWRLKPDYRIFIDSEIPFLFTEEDLLVSMYGFSEPDVLSDVLRRHEPSFIAAPVEVHGFPELIAPWPEYVLVFFDEADALYVNTSHHPEVAEQYALTALNPVTIEERDGELVLEGLDRERLLEEASRMHAVYPGGWLTNRVAAQIYRERADYERMLPPARALIKHYPFAAAGYELLGDGLRGLERLENADAIYQLGAKRADPRTGQRLARKIGLILRARHRDAEAYRAFQRSLGTHPFTADSETLYQLGSTALRIGKPRVAERMSRFLQNRHAPDDLVWVQRLRDELSRAGIEASR